ncbi:hypothetical protein [Neobacillus sp. D3-1R]
MKKQSSSKDEEIKNSSPINNEYSISDLIYSEQDDLNNQQMKHNNE